MKKSGILRALRCAFPKTIPILAGFLFLGISYGIFARVSGLSWWYPTLMSAVIFGGSLEFVAVSLLGSGFAPVQTLLMALMIQARHLFYGLAMLDKYRGTGWKKPYLIFGLCDESFSINCTAMIPSDVDAGWVMFFVTLLDQAYWITGATLGGVIGSLISFDTQGLDFAMTAMFVVIFLEQWLKDRRHYAALIGLGAAAGCLMLFGPDSFIIPSMAVIVLLLTAFRKPIEKAGESE